MTTSTPSLAYVVLFGEVEHAIGDRRRLKDLRRRIRRRPDLTDAERGELLDSARYAPGCIPPLLELGDDGELVEAVPAG